MSSKNASSASSPALNTEKIMKMLLEIKKEQKELSSKFDMTIEQNNLIMRIISDLSAKKDVEILSLNIKNAATTTKATKKTSTSASSTVDKGAMNILNYFKYKYIENPESLYDIISKEEMEKTFIEKKSVLKTKKNEDDLKAAQASALYSKYVKDDNKIKAILRTKKAMDHESDIAKQKEIVESEYKEEASGALEEQAQADSDSESEPVSKSNTKHVNAPRKDNVVYKSDQSDAEAEAEADSDSDSDSDSD